jgi:uncharacterized SAM-binding protein YcdF (DUF218 family)
MAMVEATQTQPRPMYGQRLIPVQRKRWLRRIALAFGALTLLAICAFAAGLSGFVTLLERREASLPLRDGGIVVLTGGPQRIDEGLSLLQQGLGRRLLISGVNKRTGHDDVLKMHPQMREIVTCCVDLGAQARNTIGNAIETRRWVRANGFSSLTVVTSRYHMPRTLLEFRHAMPQMDITAHVVASDVIDGARLLHEPGLLRLVSLEYAKYLVAGVRLRMEQDPELSRFAVILGGRKPMSPKPVTGTISGS